MLAALALRRSLFPPFDLTRVLVPPMCGVFMSTSNEPLRKSTATTQLDTWDERMAAVSQGKRAEECEPTEPEFPMLDEVCKKYDGKLLDVLRIVFCQR